MLGPDRGVGAMAHDVASVAVTQHVPHLELRPALVEAGGARVAGVHPGNQGGVGRLPQGPVGGHPAGILGRARNAILGPGPSVHELLHLWQARV